MCRSSSNSRRSEKAISSEEEALSFARKCEYPVILKAAAGGGGRGMRIA